MALEIIKMGNMTITSDNEPVPVLSGTDLTEEERKEFDYLNWSIPDDPEGPWGNGWDGEFVRFQDNVYDLNDMDSSCPGSQVRSMFPGWDMYQTWTFSSGVVFRYDEDDDGQNTDFVIIGTYYVS